MNNSIFLFLFISLIGTQVFARQSYLPKGDCSQKIHHTYYSLCYEDDHRQASWVKYKLTKKMVRGTQKRVDQFQQDPNVEDPVTRSDYSGTGFDRGHLAPAADMRVNAKMVRESFFMTNISPQQPSFNRGIWSEMEAFIREKVLAWGEAHVISAPILNNRLDALDSGISVPDRFYKVAYFPKKKFMLAFLVDNRAFPDDDPESFLVPIDKIEKITGFDFFARLPDPIEKDLEAEVIEL